MTEVVRRMGQPPLVCMPCGEVGTMLGSTAGRKARGKKKQTMRPKKKLCVLLLTSAAVGTGMRMNFSVSLSVSALYGRRPPGRGACCQSRSSTQLAGRRWAQRGCSPGQRLGTSHPWIKSSRRLNRTAPATCPCGDTAQGPGRVATAALNTADCVGPDALRRKNRQGRRETLSITRLHNNTTCAYKITEDGPKDEATK